MPLCFKLPGSWSPYSHKPWLSLLSAPGQCRSFISKPNKWLTINIAVILGLALLLPFTPISKVFNFVPLPMTFLLVLVGFIIVYLVLVELMKIWFYQHNSEPAKYATTPRYLKT